VQADIGGIAKEIADDEIAHVAFLRAALGDAAVPCPLMDITTAFDLAFQLAANVSEATSFDPYASPLYFLHGAFIFEVRIQLLRSARYSIAGAVMRLSYQSDPHPMRN
jgi:Ferritin-like domain